MINIQQLFGFFVGALLTVLGSTLAIQGLSSYSLAAVGVVIVSLNMGLAIVLAFRKTQSLERPFVPDPIRHQQQEKK